MQPFSNTQLQKQQQQAVMSWLAVNILGLLLAGSAAIPLVDQVDVTLIRSENDELEARVLWDNARSQIHIEAKPNKLLIHSSANGGQLLLSGEKMEGVGMFYSVEGQSFFAIETKKSDGTWKTTEFAVPNFMETVAKEAFQQRKIQQMTQLFDEGSARQLSEGALQTLARRSEVKILQEAAQKLGAMGVTGVDNKGALLFYATIMNIVRGRDQLLEKRKRALEEDMMQENTHEEDMLFSHIRPTVVMPTTNGVTLNDQYIPHISPSPSQKVNYTECNTVTSIGQIFECSTVTNTVTSTGRILFIFMTTKTTTYTTTVCPLPTNTPTPVVHNPCQKNLCPLPPTTDFKPPSRYVADYNRCALPIPAHLHPCEFNPDILCENCHHGHECERNKCPHETECLGMCGPGCWWCWSFVCGDCCHWQGCYQHDLKCRNTFFSFSCLLPFDFQCNGY